MTKEEIFAKLQTEVTIRGLSPSFRAEKIPDRRFGPGKDGSEYRSSLQNFGQ